VSNVFALIEGRNINAILFFMSAKILG